MNRDGQSFFTFTTTRPVTIFMMVLAVFTFGYISLGKLPVNLLPEIAYPTITVRTEYPGAGPEDVEERVSERIQEALSVLPGLKEISSISKPELSDVTLEFGWGTNVAFATQNIREKLDRTFLPDDVENPIILRYDPTLDPIMRIGVSGGGDLVGLRKIAEDDIQRKLETIEGVAAVKVRGGLEEEIHVEVDKYKLRALNLTMEMLNQRLAAENVNMAAGTILEGDTEYLVRTLNQFMDLEEIMNLIVTRTAEGTVRMGSLAQVKRSHKEQDIISRIDGRESVEIQIFKEAGSNIVTLAEKVKNRLLGTPTQQAYALALAQKRIPDPAELLREARSRKEKEKAEGGEAEKAEAEAMHREGGDRHHRGRGGDRTQTLSSLETDPELMALQQKVDEKKRMLSYVATGLPKDVKVRVLSDQSRFIRNSINEVRSSAILGGILAVLILYLFLKNIASTLIIALSIPISVIATFAPMFMTDTSLNIMSLGGLALGIGMLVDNSIIVLESIYRCREEGDSIAQAAVRGVSEIGGAAVASTLTTVAVFFPIAFVEGIAGQIFRDQALTVVFSLLTSLGVALFFIPMLASRHLGNPTKIFRTGYRFNSTSRMAAAFRSKGTGIKKLLVLPFSLLFFPLHLSWDSLKFLVHWSGFRFSSFSNMKRGVKKLLTLSIKFYLAWRSTPLWLKIPYTFFLLLLLPVFILICLMSLFLVFLLHFLVETVGFGIYITFVAVAWLATWTSITFFWIMKVLLWPLSFLFDRGFKAVASVYTPALSYALRQRTAMIAIFLATAALLYASLNRVDSLGQEVLPEVHQGELIAHLGCPVGSPLEQTDKIITRAEEATRTVKDVAWVSSTVGIARDEIASAEEGEHTARIYIKIDRAGGDIQEKEERVLKALRGIYSAFPEIVSFQFSRPTLFSIKSPMQVEIKGIDLEEIHAAAGEVESFMNRMEGLEDVKSTVQRGSPEVRIRFNREKLARYNLDTATLARMISEMVKGEVPTRFQSFERKIDILVRVDQEDLASVGDLKDMIINPQSPAPLPLSAVADIVVVEGPSEIRRIWGQRAAIVSANLSKFDMGDTSQKIAAALIPIEEKSTGLTLGIGGQGKELESAMQNMYLALGLAIFLVYIVMASQFESLYQPFIIICTIPLAFVGVVYTLDWFDINLSVVVFIGGIMLAGIVVNNAIVLVDYINQLRRRGLEKNEAIVKACRIRLRPILMTTATTVLGLLPLTGILGLLARNGHLLPLGIGEGVEIRAPMAITVISGLISSTILTLFIIPLVYSVTDQVVKGLGAAFKRTD